VKRAHFTYFYSNTLNSTTIEEDQIGIVIAHKY